MKKWITHLRLVHVPGVPHCTLLFENLWKVALLFVGLTNYTGLIKAGHWSRYGSGTRTPLVDDSAILGICTKGHYCPEGSEIPTPCPSGTYG